MSEITRRKFLKVASAGKYSCVTTGEIRVDLAWE
jgi:hypothetical protein